MRSERIYLDEENSDIIAFSLSDHGHDNHARLDMLKRAMMNAVKSELTDRQRDCIIMYYFQNMKMKDIAATLCLSKSTVTRHIQSAKRKLRKTVMIADLAFNEFEKLLNQI